MSELNLDWADIIANKRPVRLRNGNKAYVIANLLEYKEFAESMELNYPLQYVILGEKAVQALTIDGLFNGKHNEHYLDIVDLWRDEVSVTIPRPLKEPLDKMWYITTTGNVSVSGGKNTYNRSRFEAGFYFGSRGDAEEFLRVMKDSRG